MGGAMESSSFAHGMFHDTVSSCELLLPNGTIVEASRTGPNAELLAGIGGSYGTLASLTAATIECVRLPARPLAALTLEWYSDVAEGVAALSAMARSRSSIDFLDAAALPPSSDGDSGGVLVCSASLVDGEEAAAMEEWSISAAGDAFYYEKLLDVRRRLGNKALPLLSARA